MRDLTGQERKKEMEKIQSMFTKAKAFGDDKVNIAIQTYELVDKHIRRLDADLAKFESEMKEKGRLSQTETEDDDEEEDALPKSKRKKKMDKGAVGKAGRKKKVLKDDKATKKGKKKGAAADAGASTSGVGGTVVRGGTMLSSTGGTIPLPPGVLPVPQEILDMPVDPNEPTYCLCQQVSYGEMIGCDNNDCPIEWFHFGCMGLSNKPKGKWYCPKCIGLFKKKKGS